ncbi:hypothetical protein DYB36_003261 [Aphanomyces astaci]|uniref:Uncharacterized protein n=1 Tax=Aphanomyces astaci TaxID=112090 RepID=A0A396ZZ89_APHAT|nr:hypothetical protein DYB36_003261 [Aphanomyces astaci]
MDPDSAWLAQFSAHHLPSHETPPRTPPPTTMRGVRQTLLECLQRIRECKSLQEEMDRFATAYTTTRDEFHNLPARARTKLHYERRRAALTETLTKLRTQYSSFFGDDTALRQATSMAKRIHRKKLYQRNMKHHRQVHRHASIRMKLDHICHKLTLLQQLKASRGSTNEDDDDGVTRDVTAFLTNKTVQKTANPTLELPQHTEATTRLHPLFDQDMTMESLVAVRCRVNNPVSHITLYL